MTHSHQSPRCHQCQTLLPVRPGHSGSSRSICTTCGTVVTFPGMDQPLETGAFEATPKVEARSGAVLTIVVASVATLFICLIVLILVAVIWRMRRSEPAQGESAAAVTTPSLPPPILTKTLPPAPPRQPPTPLLGPIQPAPPPRPTLPATCPSFGSLVIENQRGDFQQTVIRVENGCHLTLRGSTLSGPEVLQVGLNATILIEGSTLRGGEVALTAADNVTIDILAKSVVTGRLAAVKTGNNSKVRVTSSHIEGQMAALALGMNAVADLTDAEVFAVAGPGPQQPLIRQAGLWAGNNGQITLNRSHVKGQSAALWGEINTSFSVTDSTLEGVEASIKGEQNLEVFLKGTQLKGRLDLGRGATLTKL